MAASDPAPDITTKPTMRSGRVRPCVRSLSAKNSHPPIRRMTAIALRRMMSWTSASVISVHHGIDAIENFRGKRVVDGRANRPSDDGCRTERGPGRGAHGPSGSRCLYRRPARHHATHRRTACDGGTTGDHSTSTVPTSDKVQDLSLQHLHLAHLLELRTVTLCRRSRKTFPKPQRDRTTLALCCQQADHRSPQGHRSAEYASHASVRKAWRSLVLPRLAHQRQDDLRVRL